MIGLRHDIDTRIEFRRGLPQTLRLEDRYDARSTLFVRAVLLEPGSEETRIILQAQKDGWEIGLHLDNTVADPRAPFSPRDELERLRSLGFDVRGVSPHGGLYGFQKEKTWKVMDSLGLEYMMGYLPFPQGTRTPVIGPHHTLDFLVKSRGTRRGLEDLKRKIEDDIKGKGWSIVLTHPVYMVFSVGPGFTMTAVNVSRKQGINAYILKQADRALKLLYTLAGVKTISKPYEETLKWARENGLELLPIKTIKRRTLNKTQ